jgi:hypothetical protein
MTYGGEGIAKTQVEMFVASRAYCKYAIYLHGFVGFEALGAT